MIARLAIFLGGLAGAIGVVTAARAYHGGDQALMTASQFMLFHAPAFIALASAERAGLVGSGAGGAVIAILALGLVLFAGDLAARSLLGTALFRMAAPIGGSLMILGWLGVAILAFVGRNSASGD